jgi:hypothetical protein
VIAVGRQQPVGSVAGHLAGTGHVLDILPLGARHAFARSTRSGVEDVPPPRDALPPAVTACRSEINHLP